MEQEKRASKTSFLVVGAGPAGLILGILLRRRNIEVTLIDREPAPFRPVCGEYLSPQGVAYLAALGLSQCLAGFREVRGMQLSSPRGRSVRAPFPERGIGIALDRREFQTRLLQSYLELGGQLFLGESVTGISEGEGGLCVRTTQHSFDAEVLIGADGRQSSVARLCGLERSISRRPRVAIHAYLKPLRPLPPYGQMHILNDGSYAGVNPIGAAEANFSIVADAALLKRHGNARSLLNYYIEGHFGLASQFAPLSHEEVKTTFPIDCRRDRITTPKVALIGDAAGFIDPLTGEGITTAIKTAVLLNDKLLTSPSIDEAFIAYARARRVDYRQKETLNRVLQLVIRRPRACELVAHALRRSPRLRRCFIGVIGNIYTPLRGLTQFFFPFFPGGPSHGQDRFRAIRVSASPTQPARGDSATADGLARAPLRAGTPGKNLRGR